MKQIKYITICFTCVLLLFISSVISGCASDEKKISKTGFYFDTIITITLYGTDNEKNIDACFSLAKDYERKFSNTIDDSEIAKINQNAGKYVTVSDETVELLQAGLDYGKKSNGKFDITIGNLSGLWNFSEIAKNLESEDNETDAFVLPDEDEIKNALSHINYKSVKIKGNEVKLTDSNAKIDLGGIAKGYIADKMREYLNSAGVTNGVISLGGNVLTLGPKENDEPYTIGIQKPFEETGISLGTLKIKDASVVSSGIYERYYRVGGKLYHHILDTKTGYPVENNLYQVTIISKSSMDGDALSTTVFTLGAKDGMELVENTKDTEAIFVLEDGEILKSSGIGENIIFIED